MRLALVALLLACHISSCQCATYYVSPLGNDEGNGISPAGAWRTIGRSVAQLTTGDTVLLADGVYPEMVRLDGMADGPITFAAQNPGQAIIDADGAFYCIGTDTERPRNLVLDGLKLRNAGMGIGLDAGADGLTVRRCEISGTLEAIRVRSGASVAISDCLVHDNRNGILLGVKGVSGVRGVTIERTVCANNADEGRTGNRDGILVEGMSSDVVIRDCVSSGAGDSGFDLKPDGTVVERCRGNGNGQWGIKLWGSGCRIVSCLMYDNDLGGIGAAGEDLQFWNCTFGANGSAGLRLETQQARTCVIRNSIFYGSRLHCLGATLPDEDYNCYYAGDDGAVISTSEKDYRMSDLARHAPGIGRHDLARDPLLVRPTQGDYRLTSGSPCRAAGLANALIELDLLGRRRSSPPDLGAIALAEGP